MIGLYIFIGIAIMALITIPCIIASKKQNEKIDKMKSLTETLQVGTDKEEVISIMNQTNLKYTKSLLKTGEEKYVWKIEGQSSSYSIKGTGMRNYCHSPTKKLTVYFKDNKVTRFDGFNLN